MIRPMQRGQVIWGWVTSMVGAVIVLLMAWQVLIEGMWLGRQVDVAGSYSYGPMYVSAALGLVLVIGGVATAISARRRGR